LISETSAARQPLLSRKKKLLDVKLVSDGPGLVATKAHFGIAARKSSRHHQNTVYGTVTDL